MFYIFTCHELNIIKKVVKISDNDDIFELRNKLESLNLTFKDYFDSLSEEKVLEANSYKMIGDSHIITKFEDKIKDNYIEFNINFNAQDENINLIERSHYLVISKKQLASLQKIPFVIKYIDDNHNIIKENILLHCYEANFNKDTQSFIIKSQCWFNNYFNYFNFDKVDNHNISLFLRKSLSFNSNTLSSSYNMDINSFYEKKILELKDYVALTSYCRNTNKDILKYLEIAKNKYSENEYTNFLAHILKYNIGYAYTNTCFEAKTSIDIFANILLDNKELRHNVFKSIFKLDYLYSINKVVKLFNDLFEDEKKIKEEELKKLNSKKKKKASKSNKKKDSNSFNLGYDLSKEYIESILKTIIDLYDDIIYDEFDKLKFIDILNGLEHFEDEQIEEGTSLNDTNTKKEVDTIIEESINLDLSNNIKSDDDKKENKIEDSQLSLF